MRSASPMDRVISSKATLAFTTAAPYSPNSSMPREPAVTNMKDASSTPQARV